MCVERIWCARCKPHNVADREGLIPRVFRQKGMGSGTARLTLSMEDWAQGMREGTLVNETCSFGTR
jgi:hypothetical protein